MPFDQHKNLAIATVTTATGAAGTTLGVGAGEGARFPAVPFNATVWPVDMAPDPTTAEVVRVTARTGDSLTITRAQEGTTAHAIIVGDMVAATITAKSLTDIESGVNFPTINVNGNVVGWAVFSAGPFGFTSKSTMQSPTDGAVLLTNNAWTDFNLLQFGGTTSAFPALKRSGAGLAVRTADDGAAADLSAGNLSVAGDVLYSGATGAIRAATNDGADTAQLLLCGGGAGANTRGAWMGLYGNEHGGSGGFQLHTGNNPAAGLSFWTGPADALRGVIHPSGGFSWGGTTDPGAGSVGVGAGAYSVGSAFVQIFPSGAVTHGVNTTAVAAVANFFNPNGFVGGISCSGSATVYSTSSDARLKTPLRRHMETAVLRDTVIHDFIWNADGTAGRGVFAQEAHTVAPFAVSVGTDDVDDEGRLTHPWGVDYSKYVPDLITGWQAHDRRIEGAFTRINDLELLVLKQARASLDQLSTRPSFMQRIRAAIAVLFPAWITP